MGHGQWTSPKEILDRLEKNYARREREIATNPMVYSWEKTGRWCVVRDAEGTAVVLPRHVVKANRLPKTFSFVSSHHKVQNARAKAASLNR